MKNYFGLDKHLIQIHIEDIESYYKLSLDQISVNQLWRFGRQNYQAIVPFSHKLPSIMPQYQAYHINEAQITDQIYKLAVILTIMINQNKEKELHSTYRREVKTVASIIQKLVNGDISIKGVKLLNS